MFSVFQESSEKRRGRAQRGRRHPIVATSPSPEVSIPVDLVPSVAVHSVEEGLFRAETDLIQMRWTTVADPGFPRGGANPG